MIDLFRMLGHSPSRLQHRLQRDTNAVRWAARGTGLREIATRLPDSLAGGPLMALLGEQLQGMLPVENPSPSASPLERVLRRNWDTPPSGEKMHSTGGGIGSGEESAKPGDPGNRTVSHDAGTTNRARVSRNASPGIKADESALQPERESGSSKARIAWSDPVMFPADTPPQMKYAPDSPRIPVFGQPNPSNSSSALVKLVHAYFQEFRSRSIAAVEPPEGVRDIQVTPPPDAVSPRVAWLSRSTDGNARRTFATHTPDDDAASDHSAWNAAENPAAHITPSPRTAAPAPVRAPDGDELVEILAHILRLQGAQHGIDMP